MSYEKVHFFLFNLKGNYLYFTILMAYFLKELFRLEQPHGDGEVYFAWQRGSGIYLTTVGSDYHVNIYNRQGKIHEKIKLQG